MKFKIHPKFIWGLQVDFGDSHISPGYPNQQQDSST